MKLKNIDHMNKNKQKFYDVIYPWILSQIDSCETLTHLNTCKNWITLLRFDKFFYKFHIKGDVIKEVRAGGESRKIKKQLLDIIDQKIDQLKTDEFGYIKWIN